MRLMIFALVVIFRSSVFAASPEEVAERAMEGYRLFVRDSLPDDREHGYAMMLEAAWEGDAKAANNIGWLMEHGEYAAPDLKGAARWYERAADQGLPAAALNYANIIFEHSGEEFSCRGADTGRLAKACMLAGTSMLMGRGLPYDSRKGEELLLRAALLGDETAAMTIAQQLEMYPDSFSYLHLGEIARQCDVFLPDQNRNVAEGMSEEDVTDTLLNPAYWYARVKEERK